MIRAARECSSKKIIDFFFSIFRVIPHNYETEGSGHEHDCNGGHVTIRQHTSAYVSVCLLHTVRGSAELKGGHRGHVSSTEEGCVGQKQQHME